MPTHGNGQQGVITTIVPINIRCQHQSSNFSGRTLCPDDKLIENDLFGLCSSHKMSYDLKTALHRYTLPFLA